MPEAKVVKDIREFVVFLRKRRHGLDAVEQTITSANVGSIEYALGFLREAIEPALWDEFEAQKDASEGQKPRRKKSTPEAGVDD